MRRLSAANALFHKSGLQDAAELGGLELSQQAAKVGVTGTFNAAALLSLQSGNAANRTAKATEETAKNTQKLVDEARNGGPSFS